MSGRRRGGGHSGGSRNNNRGRCSGETSNRSCDNSSNNVTRPDEVEFTPHYARNTQESMHDTVKKQITHNVRGKCKIGNDLEESSETDVQQKTKEDLWNPWDWE